MAGRTEMDDLDRFGTIVWVIMMERIAHVAGSHREADWYDVLQNQEKSPDERIENYIELRERIYGAVNPDIKEYERLRSS